MTGFGQLDETQPNGTCVSGIRCNRFTVAEKLNDQGFRIDVIPCVGGAFPCYSSGFIQTVHVGNVCMKYVLGPPSRGVVQEFAPSDGVVEG